MIALQAFSSKFVSTLESNIEDGVNLSQEQVLDLFLDLFKKPGMSQRDELNCYTKQMREAGVTEDDSRMDTANTFNGNRYVLINYRPICILNIYL
jgi:hypothetical protein